MDIETLNETELRAFFKKNPVSVEQAKRLIEEETQGRCRKYVLTLLSTQVRKATLDENLKRAMAEGILLPTVFFFF